MYVRLTRKTRVANGRVYPRVHILVDENSARTLCGRYVRQLSLANENEIICLKCKQINEKHKGE